MFKNIIICCLLLLACNSAFAQPKGYKAIPDASAFRKKMTETAKNTQTLKSNFTQEKNIKVVSEKIVSGGTFRFKKQNKVRMEYTHPYKYLLIINQDKVIIKDDQKTNSFSSKSNKLFTVVNNIIIDCVQGTALDNKDFTSVVYTNDKNYLLVLTPVKKNLRDFFDNINIYLDEKNFTVIKIDLVEPTGDNTVINFTDVQINVPVADAEFSTN